MRSTTRDLREGPRPRKIASAIAGMIRRVVVDLTSAAGLWKLEGYDDEEPWTDVENFAGVGFHARPRAGKGEAIVVGVGGCSDHPIVVASRDMEIQASLDEDETAVFNSSAVVKCAKNGDVVATPKTGSKVLLGGATATEAAVLGTTYRSAENNLNATMSFSLSAAAVALNTAGVDPTLVSLAPLAAAALVTASKAIDAAATALDTFEAGSTGYLSTTVKGK